MADYFDNKVKQKNDIICFDGVFILILNQIVLYCFVFLFCEYQVL